MAILGHLNGKSVVVSDSPSYAGMLEALVKSSQALTALLITRHGTVLAKAGETEYLNATAVAALVAAMFTATREMARLVGENQFYCNKANYATWCTFTRASGRTAKASW